MPSASTGIANGRKPTERVERRGALLTRPYRIDLVRTWTLVARSDMLRLDRLLMDNPPDTIRRFTGGSRRVHVVYAMY
jgi:hypothetical protein